MPVCAECQSEEWDEDEGMCLECGSEEAEPGQSKYENFRVGVVVSVAAVPKAKKLKSATVQVRPESDDGEDDGTVVIVTNTKHLEEGDRVVVAMVGAIVPAGADPDEDEDAVVVKKSAVGGKMSHGMLCDCPMLGWAGGAAGVAVKLPEDHEVGSAPPAERPRR
jgi:tRNA-binding EMAP/Myf-like protein